MTQSSYSWIYIQNASRRSSSVSYSTIRLSLKAKDTLINRHFVSEGCILENDATLGTEDCPHNAPSLQRWSWKLKERNQPSPDDIRPGCCVWDARYRLFSEETRAGSRHQVVNALAALFNRIPTWIVAFPVPIEALECWYKSLTAK